MSLTENSNQLFLPEGCNRTQNLRFGPYTMYLVARICDAHNGKIISCRPFCPNLQENAWHKREPSGPKPLTLLLLHFCKGEYLLESHWHFFNISNLLKHFCRAISAKNSF